jgi:hypothetical protein
MIKYFIKFCNYLNHFKNIFTLCSILWHHKYSHKYIFFNNLILIKIFSLFWQLHYLAIELLYFEYNLWKALSILAWWKLKVAQFWKKNLWLHFFATIMCLHPPLITKKDASKIFLDNLCLEGPWIIGLQTYRSNIYCLDLYICELHNWANVGYNIYIFLNLSFFLGKFTIDLGSSLEGSKK